MQATAPMLNGLSSDHLLSQTSKAGRLKTQGTYVWDAIQDIAATGRRWKQLLRDFPPGTTVQCRSDRMHDDGPLDVVVDALLAAWVQVAEGREPAPAAAIIASQSVKPPPRWSFHSSAE